LFDQFHSLPTNDAVQKRFNEISKNITDNLFPLHGKIVQLFKTKFGNDVQLDPAAKAKIEPGSWMQTINKVHSVFSYASVNGGLLALAVYLNVVKTPLPVVTRPILLMGLGVTHGIVPLVHWLNTDGGKDSLQQTCRNALVVTSNKLLNFTKNYFNTLSYSWITGPLCGCVAASISLSLKPIMWASISGFAAHALFCGALHATKL
jgi:hypothetical protein